MYGLTATVAASLAAAAAAAAAAGGQVCSNNVYVAADVNGAGLINARAELLANTWEAGAVLVGDVLISDNFVQVVDRPVRSLVMLSSAGVIMEDDPNTVVVPRTPWGPPKNVNLGFNGIGAEFITSFSSTLVLPPPGSGAAALLIDYYLDGKPLTADATEYLRDKTQADMGEFVSLNTIDLLVTREKRLLPLTADSAAFVAETFGNITEMADVVDVRKGDGSFHIRLADGRVLYDDDDYRSNSDYPSKEEIRALLSENVVSSDGTGRGGVVVAYENGSIASLGVECSDPDQCLELIDQVDGVIDIRRFYDRLTALTQSGKVVALNYVTDDDFDDAARSGTVKLLGELSSCVMTMEKADNKFIVFRACSGPSTFTFGFTSSKPVEAIHGSYNVLLFDHKDAGTAEFVDFDTGRNRPVGADSQAFAGDEYGENEWFMRGSDGIIEGKVGRFGGAWFNRLDVDPNQVGEVVSTLRLHAVRLADRTALVFNGRLFPVSVPNVRRIVPGLTERVFLITDSGDVAVAWNEASSAFVESFDAPVVDVTPFRYFEVSASGSEYESEGAVVELANGDVLTFETPWFYTVTFKTQGPVQSVHPNKRGTAFAAITEAGGLLTWGDDANGGDGPANDVGVVEQIVATESAFAARTADGSVVAWGNATYGGSITAVVRGAIGGSKVTALFAADKAFAVLTEDKRAVVWGMVENEDAQARRENNVRDVVPVASGFVFVMQDGTVRNWGGPEVPAELSGVASVVASDAAFAALDDDGSVVTWGSADHGGDSATVASKLASGVLSVQAVSKGFAAGLDDGSHVVWGGPTLKGSFGSVAPPCKFERFLATQHAFVGLMSNFVGFEAGPGDGTEGGGNPDGGDDSDGGDGPSLLLPAIIGACGATVVIVAGVIYWKRMRKSPAGEADFATVGASPIATTPIAQQDTEIPVAKPVEYEDKPTW